jgi:lipopolysaccharide/colanic/teichoic acid biosynthesis glycosyltransferase
MIIRIFDLVFSFLGIILLSPLFLIISIFILIDSKGGVFYKQIRVGKDNIDFTLLKFRTMVSDSDKKGLLTIGAKDNRITKIGFFLRKYKLDELPQLINVLKGEMSFVGPRPEVRKYVNLYSDYQIKVLSVRPGITDISSIKFFNENEILAKSDNPEKTYIDEIMPYKIELNFEYINNFCTKSYFRIIVKTFITILLRR